LHTEERLNGRTVGVRLRPETIFLLRERARLGHRTISQELRRIVLEDMERNQQDYERAPTA
jgi:hypothetical protein